MAILPTGSGVEGFIAAFEQANQAPSIPETLRHFRRTGFERFAALGFPTTKNEDWHYTSVAPITEQEFQLIDSAGDVRLRDLAPFAFGGADWHVMTFVNGRFSADLSRIDSLPAGVHVTSLSTAWREAPDTLGALGTIATGETHAFTALNAAFTDDGAVITVDANVEVAQPIHLVFLADATAAKGMMHPRVLVTLGRHAKATVIESYVATSDAMYFTNAVTEAVIADGATLTHTRVQREGMRAFHVGTFDARQARDSHLVSFSFATGASLSRVNVYTSLDGEGSGATMNGLYMLGETQHCDHQTQIIHAQPHCYSRELYKGVLDGQSHGVFNGKVYVHPIAQKTDGKQTNNTLLLSDKARIDTKPQLEIFADDVRCTHGATIGQIDRTALFYMKSRGIDSEVARQLLTYAFAADVLETIECEPVRIELERLALDRFTRAG
jgi:Fe-S cluster assembly protein SufD